MSEYEWIKDHDDLYDMMVRVCGQDSMDAVIGPRDQEKPVSDTSQEIVNRFRAIDQEIEDAVRRRDIRAAVDHLITVSAQFGRTDRGLDQVALGGEMGFEDARDEVRSAKTALLTLIGIDAA